MTAAPQKIFISDIHLSDARSFAGPHPYGWCRRNVPHLADFLSAHLNDPDLEELIILGDLFEQWVIPTDVAPLVSFQAICDNPANAAVITALRQFAARGILTYVPGNHDLALSTAALPADQAFMAATFPGICYSSDPTLPHGVYRQGALVAEHGNRYALFNAADTWTNPPSFLPIGYFISRLAASKVAQHGTEQDFHDIVANFVVEFIASPNFIQDLFVAMAHDAGLHKTDPVNMAGIPGFPATIAEIGRLYEDLIKDWQQQRPDLDWRTAVLGDVGDLYPAAIHRYFSLFSSAQNIVIFGHTHKADLRKNYLLQAAPAVKDIHLDLPCRSIYANCGTWVDSAPYCTYIATRADAAAGRHYVRLLAYPGNNVLQEGFVKLS